MKTSLLSLAAALLLVSNVTFAAGPPNDRRADKESNYGYPKNYKVSAKERARYEAEQRKLAEQQRKMVEQQRKQAEQQRKLADRRDDRDFNFGYPKNHQVTPQERARWEAAQRNDRDRR
ncbi:hypothetical protein Q5H93_21405 [Hymenobacter sp. ASUV-10]|uniref:DUF4890 domain-containing protein n=1 Tax=Hymenobacter aranciens TaxID=3063996 RepID=A0ABT9BKY3_9BACT|nr:hypothetical protein [Hymenobacter sp. ASUV-10]MDO7877316.1 hypothetical protein [Hymenobacter sp. ASUV-10]